MCRAKQDFAKVVKTVCEETEVNEEKLMSRCSELEVVDARHICVKLLHKSGYYPMRIAELMGVTPRYVQYILTDFEDRTACNNRLRINYERALNKLRKEGEVSV